jgi:hypothetical protein
LNSTTGASRISTATSAAIGPPSLGAKSKAKKPGDWPRPPRLTTPAPMRSLEEWLAELSVITARRQDDEFAEEVRVTAYARRLARRPADLARAALLEERWRFWPTWADLAEVCERLAAPPLAILRALMAPPAPPKPATDHGEWVTADRAAESIREGFAAIGLRLGTRLLARGRASGGGRLRMGLSWREIEDRLEEAALALRRLRHPSGSGPRGYGSSWPEYVREARHAHGYHKARIRVVPSALEIQRMNEAIDWLRLIRDAGDRRIVGMRAVAIDGGRSASLPAARGRRRTGARSPRC